jgi:hypothetical protein
MASVYKAQKMLKLVPSAQWQLLTVQLHDMWPKKFVHAKQYVASYYTMFLGWFHTMETDQTAAQHQFRILLEPPTTIQTSTGATC